MAEDNLCLHKAVFNNDLKTLSRSLRTQDVTVKDKHGKKLAIYVLFPNSCF